MSVKRYWGEGGQYGPFDTQKDGWPDAGQVMRYFREKMNLTAKEFGKLYGKEIREDMKPIGERWILEMELENKVPVDIFRRRAIARLLKIPPYLLGLASLEDINIPVEDYSRGKGGEYSKLKGYRTDFDEYERDIVLHLHLHRTTNAHIFLSNINRNIQELKQFETWAKGSLLHKIREMIVGNCLIAAKIVRDRSEYRLAWHYANEALRIAITIADSDLVMTATYTRGCINLQWGQFGNVKQGKSILNQNKVREAINDFQTVLNNNSSIHPQLRGFTLLQLARSYCLLPDANDRGVVNTLKLIDQAADTINRDTIEDLYTRMIITGTLSGLHIGGYYLTRADIYTTAKFFHNAITDLDDLDKLTQLTYGYDETRNQAWRDIVSAKALVGIGEYYEALNRIKTALFKCQSIHSFQNIVIISDIYNRLVTTSFGSSKEMRETRDIFIELLEEKFDE